MHLDFFANLHYAICSVYTSIITAKLYNFFARVSFITQFHSSLLPTKHESWLKEAHESCLAYLIIVVKICSLRSFHCNQR